MMKLLSYLAVALAAALLVVAGVALERHYQYAAAPDAEALRRELLEGFVPAAEHAELRERVARLEAAREVAPGARHRKQARPETCDANTFESRADRVMEACPCLSAGGGHRLMQAGCDDLPDTCPSLGCAEEAVGFAADCEALLAQTEYFVDGIPVAKFSGLLSSCRGLRAGAGQMLLQPVEVQMFKVRVETTEGEAQSGAMFPGGGSGAVGGGDAPPLDPLAPLPPPPAPPALPGGSGGPSAEAEHEYQVACRSAEIATCVPACNAEHHGFELLATIDGTDTKFSCNLAHGMYSWMGAASDGGFLGADILSFFSAIASGAAGAFFATLSEDAGISTDLVVRPGQDVRIPGVGVSPPSWGSGGWTVQQGGSLAMTSITSTGTF
eukprot:COSAG04_NODE_1163_length_8013_cov_106.484963_1_plen_382_part_10